MHRAICLLVIGLTGAAAGCSLAPEYARPAAPVPAEWPQGSAYAKAAAGSEAVPAWKEFLADEHLGKVVAAALENNRDLRLAALNVERVRAMYNIQRAELLPSLAASASWTRQRVPADLSGMGKPMTTETYSANLGVVAWEIDFFGRIRSLTDQALNQYLATEQARRSTQILLVSQVAGTYLTLAADREGLKIAQSTLDSQQAAFDLVKRRFEGGRVPELDVYQAQSRVESARVDVALYTQRVAMDENALTLLVGSPVSKEWLPQDLGSVKPPREVSAGVSSEVLLHRPDIIQAENILRGANANIGAARAAFFPRISLTTALGAASNDLSGLFGAGSGAWSYAPQIVMPIFDARLWGALEASKAEKNMAIAQYEKSIQTAFREVADALAVQGTVDKEVSAQESLVQAQEATYRLATARYTKGLDNYLVVLDAQRSLYGAQQGLVALRLEKIANQVRLYAVLGGGWQSEPAAPEKPL
jgi:outer membrane protein, multidrug efflux system